MLYDWLRVALCNSNSMIKNRIYYCAFRWHADSKIPKAQQKNGFFATVNQMFGGFSQLLTTAERAVVKSLSTVQTTKQCSAVVGSWEEPPKNAFVGWALNFRVYMLLKGAVIKRRHERFIYLVFCLTVVHCFLFFGKPGSWGRSR